MAKSHRRVHFPKAKEPHESSAKGGSKGKKGKKQGQGGGIGAGLGTWARHRGEVEKEKREKGEPERREPKEHEKEKGEEKKEEGKEEEKGLEGVQATRAYQAGQAVREQIGEVKKKISDVMSAPGRALKQLPERAARESGIEAGDWQRAKDMGKRAIGAVAKEGLVGVALRAVRARKAAQAPKGGGGHGDQPRDEHGRFTSK